MTAKEKVQCLIDADICGDWDEAVHFAVDCGEIDCAEHEELLSAPERERVYG